MMQHDDLYTEDISKTKKFINLSICIYINSFISTFTVFYALLNAIEISDLIHDDKISEKFNFWDIKFWDCDIMFVPVVYNLFWIIAGKHYFCYYISINI